MGNDIVKVVRNELASDAMRKQLEMALPDHVPADRLIRVAMSALQKTPKLQQCDKLTIYKAVMESAQLGLVPDGVLGEAYFVPYGNVCTLIVGYRGLCALAMRSGKVDSIYAEVAYENDDFDWQIGDAPKLYHKRRLNDRGKMIAAYAVAHLKNAKFPQIVVMSKEDVDKIKNRSKAKSDGPWKTDYDQMACKTVIRRLCKNLPLSPELVEAAARGEYHEAGTLEVAPLPLTTGRSSFGFKKQTPQEEVGLPASAESEAVSSSADSSSGMVADITPPDLESEPVPASPEEPDPFLEEEESLLPQEVDNAEHILAQMKDLLDSEMITKKDVSDASKAYFGSALSSKKLVHQDLGKLKSMLEDLEGYAAKARA